MKKFILDKLECFNDEEFVFEPIKHKYTYLGEQFVSVTTLIQQFHKPFEKDYWAQKKADEAGVPKQFILDQWQDLNDIANEIGSDTHDWIEYYFNQEWKKLPTNLETIKRINKFNIIYAEYLYKLEPLKFEVRIFSKIWKIAGMIDALFL